MVKDNAAAMRPSLQVRGWLRIKTFVFILDLFVIAGATLRISFFEIDFDMIEGLSLKKELRDPDVVVCTSVAFVD